MIFHPRPEMEAVDLAPKRYLDCLNLYYTLRPGYIAKVQFLNVHSIAL